MRRWAQVMDEIRISRDESREQLERWREQLERWREESRDQARQSREELRLLRAAIEGMDDRWAQREEERARREAERDAAYQDQLRITREVIRRNEIAFQDGRVESRENVRILRELQDEVRAQTRGILALVDRLEGGGAAAG